VDAVKLEKLGMIWELIKQRVLIHVNGFYLWLAVTLCVVVFASSLVSRLLLSSEIQARQAFEKGQRIVYHLEGGEVDGTPRHTKRATQTLEAVVGKGGAVVGETFAGHEGLAAAPLDAITEQSDKGLIPTAGSDGTLAWKYYARPYTPETQRPIVAILITNLGLSRPLTEEVFKLPHTVTLSFSPYASDAKLWAKKARAAGFESLIDVPMEPSNYPISDPGPYGLLNALAPEESRSRLQWTLSRYPGFVGLLAPADEKMTINLSSMRLILTELTARGVLFVYKKTPENNELANLIKTQNMIAIGADAVIDEDLTPSAITRQLDALAEIAKQQGYAIGIAHSYPPTTAALAMWAEELDKKGVDIAPISAVAKKVFP
jgi:uncharacterized protein